MLGSLWAASEILLGSFLHNLRVPLRGHLLTAIAVALLAAGQRVWQRQGVVWRAGLIAAAMKAVSPSAVLLGPMVAIAMEGIAFEVGLGLARGGLAGCLLGGALAMAWTLFHQLGSLLITYGLNLVEVYSRLVGLAGAPLGALPLGEMGPVAALAGLHLLVGALAAAAGWRAAGQPPGPLFTAVDGAPSLPLPRSTAGVTPHLGALVALALALPAGLLALARLPLPAAAAVVAGFLAVGAWRWGGALRRLVRPRFWVSIALLTAATAVAFEVGTGGGEAATEGVRIAALMTLRAMFVTASFAALAVELANPCLHGWAARFGGAQLVAAGQIAFATLPRVIAAMPAPRAMLRHPLRAVGALAQHLDAWLAEVEGELPRPLAVVLTGEVGAGKTTFAARLVALLQARRVPVGGILAPGLWRDGQRWGFELQEVGGATRLPLSCREAQPGWVAQGSFFVNPAAVEIGRRWLEGQRGGRHRVVVLDEVGPWELGGGGWAAALAKLVADPPPVLVLVVRRGCVKEVLERFRLTGAEVIEVSVSHPASVAERLAQALEQASVVGQGKDQPGRREP